MKRFILILIASVITLGTVPAKDEISNTIQKIKDLTEQGYFTFEKKDYMEATALCQRVLEKDNGNAEARYYLAYSSYRLMNISMVNGADHQMKQFADQGKAQAETLLSDKDYNSEAHTLLAGIIMLELAVDPSMGMELSAKVHSHLEQAIDADPDNPRTYLVKGVMTNKTPQIYGGGSERALNSFLKAKKLFEYDKPGINMPSWGKLENMAWLGQAFAAVGKLKEAKVVYEEALSIKPDFFWVKYKLLPALESKINKLIETK